MKELLDYREYQTLKPSEKLRSLKKFWGLADSAKYDFIGRVENILELKRGVRGDTIIEVQPMKVDPMSKMLSLVENPFNRELSDIKLISGSVYRTQIDPNIQQGSWISYKITVRTGELEEEKPIQIDQIVKRFDSFAELDPFIPESFPELQKRIQSIHRMAYISVPEDIFDVMNEELGKKINEISELDNRITEMRAEKDQYSNQLAALQSELENEKSRIKKAVTKMDKELSAYREKRKQDIDKNLNESIQNETTMLSRLKTEKERLYAKLQSYRQRGFMLNIADIEERQKEYEENALDALEIAKKIQVYLHSEKKLQYDISILNQFLLALRTNQLIVLCGPPGTGKTSLVEGFAEAIGAKAKIMSVQPNWTDNQDLLGFFNPIEKRYISTPFLDTLIEARENPRKLYLLCLDEMNLAHVEYYFAEFLSKMESSTKTLDLYSEKYYRDLMTEFDLCDQRYGMLSITEMKKQAKDIPEDLERINEFAMNCPIEPRFRIPENVRFIGTINLDETTKTLSPKVIDRSYFIEIPDVDGAKLKRQIDGETASEKQMLFAAMFLPMEKELDKESKEWIDKRVQDLQKLKVSCSKRMMKHLKELYGSWPGPEEDFKDYVLSGKILPQIAYAIEDDEDRANVIKKVKQVKGDISDMEVSSSKLNRMLIQIDSVSNNQFTYWG